MQTHGMMMLTSEPQLRPLPLLTSWDGREDGDGWGWGWGIIPGGWRGGAWVVGDGQLARDWRLRDCNKTYKTRAISIQFKLRTRACTRPLSRPLTDNS